MFSARLPERLTENRVSQAVALARRSDRNVIDLTETNPTVVGLTYPQDVAVPLADPGGAVYEPSPFGLEATRRVIAAGYPGMSHDRIVLTASTSEAYSLLFKLLCDAGDEVLVPEPSYPLFELLTRLDSVRDVPYRLDRDSGWAIDRASVERARSDRTRAVLIVSPNNPTGSLLTSRDREWLAAFALEHRLALISDEVFADYPLAPRRDATSLAGESRALTFALGGLSKSAGLPQMKLAWIAASGPDELVARALDRLAIVADSYLSVATPVQLAAARLVQHGAMIRAGIRSRLERNLETLAGAVRAVPSVTLYSPEGGWSAVLRVPAILSDEEFVLRLLEEHGVIVHPGYFFDLEGEGFLVTSLLPEPSVFERGVRAILELVSEVGR